MTYQHEREQFLLTMQAEGMPPEIARHIMRHANTIQRLSVAECNGDYPCDNGERKVEWCSRCEAGYAKSSMRREPDYKGLDGMHHRLICPNCRAQDLIRQWCDKAALAWEASDTQHRSALMAQPFVPIFGGDPRGACVKLRVPSGKSNTRGTAGIYVPTRRY